MTQCCVKKLKLFMWCHTRVIIDVCVHEDTLTDTLPTIYVPQYSRRTLSILKMVAYPSRKWIRDPWVTFPGYFHPSYSTNNWQNNQHSATIVGRHFLGVRLKWFYFSVLTNGVPSWKKIPSALALLSKQPCCLGRSVLGWDTRQVISTPPFMVRLS